ncbi:IDEAL domain-containing protein [Bacillus sp. V-88]|uniref:IDEAL domain-containing protein n=1 Tax=Rossellomorea vietnamensis TaxID=218284 RepID=UPI000553A67F|nr:IDEAL domain-containing protein [Rossellomorea vietnamensis]OXS63809.1 phosphoesterase [Bacillus sp. DSM 27956]PRX78885.1 IDEAL domain-containing protein [Bacillus sp. V-88]SLK14578.1 IDEAL domain-containing protein [Bacillus sp. V-88]
MKKYLLNSPQSDVNHMDSLFAEMILDEALLTFRKEQIAQGIDQALCNRNKKEFLRLTEELKEILSVG